MNKKLLKIQKELNIPKNQYNDFGGYSYRSCEDIFEAVKPLLFREGLLLTMTDEIIIVGDRNYVKATAILTDGEKEISVSAYAREAVNPKAKTDDSQLTGGTSSYARKYALNGLFLIDDVKDSDSTNKHEKESYSSNKDLPWLNVTDYQTGAINDTGRKIKEELASGKTAQEIIEMAEKKYKLSAKVKGLIEQWGKEATEEEPFDDNQFEEITKEIK